MLAIAALIAASPANSHVMEKKADKAYGTGENYKYLHKQEMTPCISHKRNSSNCDPAFNHDKFIYNSELDCYICPAGKPLKRKQFKNKEPYVVYKADRKTCEQCQHFKKCVTSKQFGRQIKRSIYKKYVDWADNCLTKYERKRLMARRKYKAEGSFADAANNHGFKRSRFRGIEKTKIQNLMIAAIQNLRKLLRQTSNKPAGQACNPALKLCLSADFAFVSRFPTSKQIFQPY